MPDLGPAGLGALQKTLGYTFAEPERLRAALVHTSFVNERPDLGLEANERLEFLGDAVIGMVVAHRLYLQRPDSPEGEMTVIRAWLVRQSTLARWARQARIGDQLLLGRGELRSGGRERPAILARAFEAILGAVYLDGGLSAAEQVLIPYVDFELERGFSAQGAVDPKSKLQQVSQARFDTMPTYQEVEQTGPGHAPKFVFEVVVGPEIRARGTGHSKRSAQQAAARAALQALQVNEGYEAPLEVAELP